MANQTENIRGGGGEVGMGTVFTEPREGDTELQYYHREGLYSQYQRPVLIASKETLLTVLPEKDYTHSTQRGGLQSQNPQREGLCSQYPQRGTVLTVPTENGTVLTVPTEGGGCTYSY